MKVTIDMVPVWSGYIDEKGRPVMDEPQEFAEYKRLLKGRKIEFILREYIPGRTASQNAYYWFIVGMVAEHRGISKKEAHRDFKGEFLYELEDPALPGVRTTTKLNKRQFAIYIEACARVAAMRWGCIVPPPENVVSGVDWDATAEVDIEEGAEIVNTCAVEQGRLLLAAPATVSRET